MSTANGSATTPIFWSAPDLAKAGYPVFPVKDKAPSVEGGFYAATTDVSQVAEWITEGREHHDVAFATGIVSGIVVLDADTPETAARIEAEYGEPTVRTARGGHWYFRHPRNGKVPSAPVADGLDRKGDGGYAIAPPSRGRSWIDGMPLPENLPILPAEFRAKPTTTKDSGRAATSKEHGRAVEAIFRHVAGITAGSRHEHLKHLCGVLLAREIACGDAERILVEAWAQVGGELAERAEREIPNTLTTTQQAIADGRATGVPKMEEITPGLYEELEAIFGWKVRVTVGGCGIGEDGPGGGEGAQVKEERRNQADRLIGYALEDVGHLFVDQHGAPHALIAGEPVPLTSRCYSWLRRLMWEEEGRSVSGEYLKMAAGTLSAHAEFSGESRELYTRAAWQGGVLYYELKPGKVVRVGPRGWTFEANIKYADGTSVKIPTKSPCSK